MDLKSDQNAVAEARYGSLHLKAWRTDRGLEIQVKDLVGGIPYTVLKYPGPDECYLYAGIEPHGWYAWERYMNAAETLGLYLESHEA